VISNSYGAPEYAYGAHTQAGYEQQFMLAAAMGISVHFASGDSADFQLNTPVGAATYPASSPYVTAVGGTSLGIPNGNGGVAEVGWGEHRVVVNSPITGSVSDPPTLGGVSGSGGGESLQFAKPSWQSALPGTGRQTPDIAALADPATGVPIVFSAPTPLGTIQELEIVGGTSLASPLFSGIWTLANQKAGTWLGQAAPAIARMPSTALNDIVPIGSETNVTGTVVDAGGTHLLSANTIAAPLFGVTSFFSAIITPTTNSPQPLLITFGTDQSLTITPGWDNVTGFGSPRGLPFITAAAAGQ
jgi:subtilase family serine protease